MKNHNLPTKKVLTWCAICLLFAVAYVLVLSASTSPLYPYFSMGHDSFQFLTMGKAWFHGIIPYKDMFDHKGPFIFFVDMIGYFLGNNTRYGVVIIQVFFMMISLTGVIYLSEFISEKSIIRKLLYVSVFLITVSVNYMSGNLVEEYCLPFVVWSTIRIYKFMENYDFTGKALLEPEDTVLYGITCGICLLTRATNAMPLVGGAIVIILVSIRSKAFTNLLKNIMVFVIAMGIVVAPFCIYFLIKGSIAEMFFAMITYNKEYAALRRPWIIESNARDIVRFFHLYFSVFSILLIAVVNWFNRQYAKFAFSFITFGIELFFYMSNDLFIQYPMVCATQVILLCYEIEKLYRNKILIGAKINIPIFIAICTLLFSVGSFCKTAILDDFIAHIFVYGNYSYYCTEPWEELVDMIPDKKEPFVTYGSNDLKPVYVLKDIDPCYKYFSIQPWHSMYDASIAEEIRAQMLSNKAKWILCDEAGRDTILSLNTNYYVYAENGGFSLLECK